jgi:translation initiation factor 6
MDIIKSDVYRGPNIGIYTKANDDHVFLPNGFAKSKAENLAKNLKTDYIITAVANTRLLGILMAVNNHGILLPYSATQNEIENLKKSTDLNVQILDTKHNALGNLICINDKAAVVSPLIPKTSIKEIEDVMDVEVIQKKVAGFQQVGAVVVASSTGGIIHPETDEDDVKTISKALRVELEPATINGGIPYLSSGILVNNNAMVVGSLTSGPEIMMLTRAFAN